MAWTPRSRTDALGISESVKYCQRMVINFNSSAATSVRSIAVNSNLLSKSLARLSSGSRIVSPEDDAGGVAVVARLTAQLARNQAAGSLISNAASLSQTQDGFLQQVSSAMGRLGELATLAEDSSKSASDLSNYMAEFTQLQNLISDIGTKKFASITLFSSTAFTVPVNGDGTIVTINKVDLTNSAVTIGLANIYNASSTAVSNATSAATALSNIQTAIQTLAMMRAQVGINLTRLNLASDQASQFGVGLSAGASAIKDVDVAGEAVLFARYSLLTQAASTMLSQANTVPVATLRLLQSL